jgi:hypothetical protein
VSAEIEMGRGWRAVELRSITHPLHEAKRMGHPVLWMSHLILLGYLGLACCGDGISGIQRLFAPLRMMTHFSVVVL